MEGSVKRLKPGLFIELVPNSWRMECTVISPVCIANTARVEFSLGLTAGLTVSIQILSNKRDVSLLQVDMYDMEPCGIPQVLTCSGPDDMEVPGACLKWGKTKPTSFRKEDPVNHRRPIVFALGLVKNAGLPTEVILAKTECFFLVSNTRDRKKGGKLFAWIQVDSNVKHLSEGFYFRPTNGLVSVNDHLKHNCEDIVAVFDGKKALPSCCADWKTNTTKDTEPRSPQSSQPFVEIAYSNENAFPSTRTPSANVSNDNMQFLLDEDDSNSLFENMGEKFLNGDLSYFDPNPLGAATTPPKVFSLSPVLLLQVGGEWGLAGRDSETGVQKVAHGSSISLRLAVLHTVDVQIKLWDIDRTLCLHEQFRLEPNTTGNNIKLPSPDQLGMYILDIAVGKETPITLTYLVYG